MVVNSAQLKSIKISCLPTCNSFYRKYSVSIFFFNVYYFILAKYEGCRYKANLLALEIVHLKSFLNRLYFARVPFRKSEWLYSSKWSLFYFIPKYL